MKKEKMKVTSFGLYPSTMKEFKKYRNENSATADQALRKLLKDDERKEVLISDIESAVKEWQGMSSDYGTETITNISRLIYEYEKEGK